MYARRQTTKEADRKSITSYQTTMTPQLTTSDDSGLNDDLYAKRLLKQMLAELEATLPETFHICTLHYDSDPMGYTESIGVVLLVPAEEGNHSFAMKGHALADRMVNKAITKVFDYDPDHNGVVLSTYGVLPCGTLVVDK